MRVSDQTLNGGGMHHVRTIPALTVALACLGALAGGASQAPAVGMGAQVPRGAASPSDWIQLFNGRDLSGWTPKFAHYPLGENVNQTFRVEDGLLKVRYDKWETFNDEFGHLFYKEAYSYYRLAAEYRFIGEQVKTRRTDLAWALRNNGLMLHCQDPTTMLRDQDFPISIEVQLLGGLGDGRPRSTANLCTPGTHVVMDGTLETRHCINSRSKTYDGDHWVRVEVEVHGGELVKHIVEGETVLEYTKPQIGGGYVAPVEPKVKVDGTPLARGYIALQAETAPIDFRKVELLNLEGCSDARAANHKAYVIKPSPSMCRY